MVAGWGLTEKGSSSTDLKEATMITMSDEKCSEGLKRIFPAGVTKKALCTSPGTGKQAMFERPHKSQRLMIFRVFCRPSVLRGFRWLWWERGRWTLRAMGNRQFRLEADQPWNSYRLHGGVTLSPVDLQDSVLEQCLNMD